MAQDKFRYGTGSEEDKVVSNGSTSRVATVGLGLVCASILTTVSLSAPFLRRFSGAPYVASATSARRLIISRLRLEAEKKVGCENGEELRIVDLGSGSGDVLLEAAQKIRQVRATGYELNVWLVWLSRWRAYRQGVASRVHFVWGDMWHAPLKDMDAIIVFGIPAIMNRIAGKIESETRNGCLVASNSFHIDKWRPIEKEAGVWLYRIGVSNRVFENTRHRLVTHDRG